VAESLRFLADESCDCSVVRALRQAGFDVAAVSEVAPAASDENVIQLASDDGRIVVTED
jgi:predicted nuclease of predicted toxin-antitoxin system